MENETRIIREFVYVDVPKLYSLYSQIFKGVTDQSLRQLWSIGGARNGVNSAQTGDLLKNVGQ